MGLKNFHQNSHQNYTLESCFEGKVHYYGLKFWKKFLPDKLGWGQMKLVCWIFDQIFFPDKLACGQMKLVYWIFDQIFRVSLNFCENALMAHQKLVITLENYLTFEIWINTGITWHYFKNLSDLWNKEFKPALFLNFCEKALMAHQ